MYNDDAELLTLENIESAYKTLRQCPPDLFHRTPLLSDMEYLLCDAGRMKLHLKLENTQVTGSFKVRGTIIQFKQLPPGYGTEDHKLVSISAGNYGKAFAYMASKMKRKGLIVMPDTAPDDREAIIRSYGADVERAPTPELTNRVHRHCHDHGMLFLHSFDDPNLFAGYGSIGLEILEDVTDPDVVVVCCGGGGLLSGISSAIKLSGHEKCRIYGVEPEGSRTMYESYKAGHAVTRPVKSVASGLSPPFAGANCYKHCREHVEDILLVSDREILTSTMLLYKAGLVVEPSGAAAFSALQHGKVPNVEGKKVVVVITGGNVSPEEMFTHSRTVEAYENGTE